MASKTTFDKKYAQNQGQCFGHWTGTPNNGTHPGFLDEKKTKPKCWACKYGCAVLSVLAVANLDPNEANIKANVDSNANCTWKGWKTSDGVNLTLPAIAGNGQHYVIVTGKEGSDKWKIWNPSGGKIETVPKSSYSKSLRVKN